jgi:hypothetical protein
MKPPRQKFNISHERKDLLPFDWTFPPDDYNEVPILIYSDLRPWMKWSLLKRNYEFKIMGKHLIRLYKDKKLIDEEIEIDGFSDRSRYMSTEIKVKLTKILNELINKYYRIEVLGKIYDNK